MSGDNLSTDAKLQHLSRKIIISVHFGAANKKIQEIRQVGSSDSPKNSFAEVKETKVRLKDILVNYDKMSVTH